MLGLRGIRVDRPEDVGPAWDEAFAADRPVVYEAIVDRGAIIRQTLRDLVEEYVPH